MTTTAKPRVTRADPKKVLLASASRPTNLAVLGSGTLGTLALASAGLPVIGVAVAGLGLLAYGAMIAFDFKNPTFVRRAHGIPDDPYADLPSLERPLVPGVPLVAIEPPELRELYRHVLASHEQLRTQLGQSPEFVRAGLSDAYLRASELVGEAGRVAKRGNGLSRYLNGEDRATIADEARVLEDNARATRDAQARATYEAAAKGKRRHVEIVGAIEGLYDRVKAQLVAIDGSFDEVRATVVKLDASDTAEAVAMGQTIADQVGQLAQDARELDSAVEQTLQEYAT